MTVYHIKLQVLSPIHIGDGNELKKDFDFVVHNKHTYRVNEDALLLAKQDLIKLDNHGQFPPPGKLLTEKDFQNPTLFRYILRGFPRSTKTDARVKSFIKDIYDHPYIPGSSIKGAFRTALAWTGWKEVKPDLNNLKPSKSWAGQPVERRLFGSDPNHDLLRALQISDLINNGKPSENLVLVNAQVLTQKSHGSPVELEAVAGDVSFEGTLKIDDTLFNNIAEPILHFSNRRHWLDELMPRTQQHSHARIIKLAEWFEHTEGTHNIAQFYRQLADSSLKKNQALMQIGWGAGWDSKTYWTYLQENPAKFESIVRNYRMHKGAKGSRRVNQEILSRVQNEQ
jgi:CRISPR-associated protein Csm5